jgi:hypothetical protein
MDIDMLRQHLDGAGFPAKKYDLILWAAEAGAGSEEIETLKKLPVDNFDSMRDLLGAASTVQQQR